MFFGLWYIGLIEAACGEIESTSKGFENKKCIQNAEGYETSTIKAYQNGGTTKLSFGSLGIYYDNFNGVHLL